ncbi:MAG TPA: hypothetical protein ACQGQJ_10070 [Xylella fastidiosa subsp. multiplex]
MSLNGWQRIFIGVCVLVIVLAIFIGFMTYPEESKSFYTNRCFGMGVENTYTIEEAKKRLKQLRLSDLEAWGGRDKSWGEVKADELYQALSDADKFLAKEQFEEEVTCWRSIKEIASGEGLRKDRSKWVDGCKFFINVIFGLLVLIYSIGLWIAWIRRGFSQKNN